MRTDAIIRQLKEKRIDLKDEESFLAMLYECYEDVNGLDNKTIKADFDHLYQVMNGKTIREMDGIIYPVCTLCRDHQRSGFIEGIKVGIQLAIEEGLAT
mgnify:CR=1 FL=1